MTISKRTTGYNMGFSILAEEYVLIIPSPIQLQFGLNEQNRATKYNINCINFTQLRFGLTNHRISAQLKALPVDVNCHATLQLKGASKNYEIN